MENIMLFLSIFLFTTIWTFTIPYYQFPDAPSFESVWTPNLSFYSGYDVTSLRETSQKMAEVLLGLENSKFKSIYNKYKSKDKLCISKQVSIKLVIPWKKFHERSWFVFKLVLYLFDLKNIVISQVGLKYRGILESIVDEWSGHPISFYQEATPWRWA